MISAQTSTSKLLTTRLVEKVWGCDSLPAPFAMPLGQKIGEIWFEPPVELPSLLAKYLFTSEKLSVQVHPSTDEAQAGEEGKEECWLVLEADEDARLAIGFKEEISPQAMRAAALDGSIEGLLDWHPVKAGDFFHLAPGTVHAIGPGLTLVEIQQNSDTTFRLFDYGRPRELHLDRAIDVALGTRFPADSRSHVSIIGAPDRTVIDAFNSGLLIMPLAGSVTLDDCKVAAGECAYAPSIDSADFSSAETTLLVRPN